MSSLLALYRRVDLALNPPKVSSPNGLKFGILGAANIAPFGIIRPALNHPDAVVYAVAARDQSRADAFAKKWSIPKAYGGEGAYQKLLDDPEIDAIYNPLPNGLHYEWTMKALAAGKHVLLEKPSTNTAEETRRMFELADKKGLVLLEAFHYRFHPAAQRAKEIVDSGVLGPIKSIHTTFCVPGGFIKNDDIRFDFKLGGGSVMDPGCYPISSLLYISSMEPLKVVTASATTHPKKQKIDTSASAELELPGGVKAKIESSLVHPGWGPFGLIPDMSKVFIEVVGEEGEMKFYNYVAPWFYHYITIKSKDGSSKTEKVYAREGWTTYRYQLEAFIDKVRGRTPQHWINGSESVADMVWIENVYKALDLDVRPASTVPVSTT